MDRTNNGERLISVVLPVYQEAEQIAANLVVIRNHLLSTGFPFEIVVADDGSRDGTWKELRRAAEEVPELVAVRLSRNFGKEAAICAGLDRARGDACIIMDADLQHPPDLIPEMIRLWHEEGWEIVNGVKQRRGRESFAYKMSASLFYKSLNALAGHDLRGASDFKLLDRAVVSAWHRLGEHSTFFRGIVSWLGFSCTDVPFDVAPRTAGHTRWSFLRLVRLAIGAITSFSALPLQVVTLLGGLVLVAAVGLGTEALYLYYRGVAVPGFTTVILLQLIIGGFLMVSLGIIGTYIAQIYEEVKRRPRYLVREVVAGAEDSDAIHSGARMWAVQR